MDPSQLRTHRLNNGLHALLLLGGLAGLLVVIGWVLAGGAGMLWAGVIGLAALVLTPRISPALILRMYRAQPLAPGDVPGLHDLVARLAARAEVPTVPVLYYVPSPLMNAFSVGRREDAAIAVTDGLLRGLPSRELTAVLAHEVSHIGHNDMWIMSLADSASRIVRVMSLLGQVLVLVNLPMFLLQVRSVPWLAIGLLLLAPTLGALLQLALSRNREFDADLEAVQLTGDAAGLAQALERLERHQERLWQHVLWPGYRNRQPSLLRTHPASEERIERLRSLAPAGQGWAESGVPGAFVPPPWGRAAPLPRHRWHGVWF